MNACLALNACTKKGQPFRATLGALLSGEFHGLAENIHAKHPTLDDAIIKNTSTIMQTRATSSPTLVLLLFMLLSLGTVGQLPQCRGQRQQ